MTYNFSFQGKLFAEAIRSNFGDFVREVVDFYHQNPEIGDLIRRDQLASALASKHERSRRANDELLASLPLEGLEDADLSACSLDLKTGRPRMDALVVFVFLMLRGREGGPCRASTRELALESRSLEAALSGYLSKLPGATTILENINLISDLTITTIHQLQLRQALGAGLDDFARIAVDSTAVEAASAWPTDSKTIVDLCARFLVGEKQLSAFGYRHGALLKAEKWLEQLSGLHKAISMAGNGANAQRKRRKLYQDFFVTACKLIEHLLERYRLLLLWNESVQLPPRQREHLNLLLQVIGDDVHDAAKTLHHGIDRVQLGRCAKMRDRVLGIADRAASIIVKGGREPVMGYKPQIARSASGFVTAIIVESGNPSDSGKLDELVRESQRVTTVMPREVSADDGYASANGLNGLYALGVVDVSISGAKGKRLLGELWELPVQQQLRGWRSSIESLMFVLKHSYRFGKLGRRGLDAVRRELTEKAIAYNFDRILLLRSHAKQHPAAPALAAESQHPPQQTLAA